MKNERNGPPFLGGDPLYPEVPRQDRGHQIRRQRMINATLKKKKRGHATDLVTLTPAGRAGSLVHGGGPAINEMLKKKVGVESHFAGGLRVTDDATMEIVQQVLPVR